MHNCFSGANFMVTMVIITAVMVIIMVSTIVMIMVVKAIIMVSMKMVMAFMATNALQWCHGLSTVLVLW